MSDSPTILGPDTQESAKLSSWRGYEHLKRTENLRQTQIPKRKGTNVGIVSCYNNKSFRNKLISKTKGHKN